MNTEQYAEDVKRFNDLYIYTGKETDFILFSNIVINLDLKSLDCNDLKEWMDLRNIDIFSLIKIGSTEDGNTVLLNYKKSDTKLLRRTDSIVCTKCQCSQCISDNDRLYEKVRDLEDSIKCLE